MQGLSLGAIYHSVDRPWGGCGLCGSESSSGLHVRGKETQDAGFFGRAARTPGKAARESLPRVAFALGP